MPLCINQSGTWRRSANICINQSGTWRTTQVSCINQSGTWREHFRKSQEDVRSCPLGTSIEGGFLICRSSGVAWIVAPSSSQVSRTWYSRNDAVTTAQQVSGCTGWFVPTCGQLQNPGYTCRTFWDSYASAYYWSSTEPVSGGAWYVNFFNGSANTTFKTLSLCVRAFRCVTY